jgi:hypothetical protein
MTVLFGEKELQQTFSFDSSTTVADAKKHGSERLLEYLHLQPGAPPGLSIDESCTDFYPGMIRSQ